MYKNPQIFVFEAVKMQDKPIFKRKNAQRTLQSYPITSIIITKKANCANISDYPCKGHIVPCGTYSHIKGEETMVYIPTSIQRPIQIQQVVTVHYFEYSSNYAFVGESHDFWEFVYVDKGEIVVTAEDKELPLKKGEMVFHRPGEFHSLRANRVVAPNLVIASFYCHSPAMEFFENRILTIGDKERSLMAKMVEEAADAFCSPLDDPMLLQMERNENAPFAAEQIVAMCLEWMLIELLRRKGEQTTEKPSSLIREKSQNEFIDRVCQYLEDNISRRLTLSDVCRDNLVGRSYLQKIFREKTGGGAMEYFGILKIKKAKEMIREGSHNFTEISTFLGYNSIHYFSRHFKKVTGMTPSEYASSVKVLAQKNGLR